MENKVKLNFSRKDAEKQIQQVIDSGKSIQSVNIMSEEELDNAWRKTEKWKSTTKYMLINLFSDSSIADEFYKWSGMIYSKVAPWDKRVGAFDSYLQDHLDTLDSIISRLEYIEELHASSEEVPSRQTPENQEEIFIVHGRDEEMLQIVKNFISKLGFKPIILKEQAGGSSSTAEKLEQASTKAKVAIVLLTSDDIGGFKGTDVLDDRARQNVIYEIGKFHEKLGRNNVPVVLKEKVEIPSDILGMNYISWYNSIESWQILLGRELLKAGLSFDFNKAL